MLLEIWNTITTLFFAVINEIIASITHNWFPLSFAIVVVAIMTAYVDPEKLKKTILKKSNVSIWGSVTVGAFTPLCACGTSAVIIAMLTAALPWGPVMAFLTSSPHMSPEGFVMLAGIVNIRFAIALTVASIVIGIGSGYLTVLIEKKTSFLDNQVRFNKKNVPESSCGCAPAPEPTANSCGCSTSIDTPNTPQISVKEEIICCAPQVANSGENASVAYFVPAYELKLIKFIKNIKWKEMGNAIVNIGVKKILLFFSLFIGIGYLINYFVPTEFIAGLFSGQHWYSVPLASFIGFPIYVSGEAAIPLIDALMKGGAGGGSMLAFMITGQGTSAWVIAGLASFLKRKVLGLYVGLILVGGILCGYAYQLYLAIVGTL